MGRKHWGQRSLLPTGLFPSQHKALLSWCSGCDSANKTLQSHHRAAWLISPKIHTGLLFRLKWRQSPFDLWGCSQSSNHFKAFKVCAKVAYCLNNSDKSVTARSRCVDTVTRCLQDHSSNLWPDFCRHGNDFKSPPKYLTQLLLKLIRYIETPHIILAFFKETHHTHVEVMRNLSAASLHAILFCHFRTSSTSGVHTKGRPGLFFNIITTSEWTKQTV